VRRVGHGAAGCGIGMRCDKVTCRPQAVALTLCSPAVTVRTARFNIQQCYVLPTQCVCVFCVDLRTNSDYFRIQH
jgi:hypothetical protein